VLPLSGLAGSNPASCREKNTLTPELVTKMQFECRIIRENLTSGELKIHFKGATRRKINFFGASGQIAKLYTAS
jgi:hypothetical protein